MDTAENVITVVRQEKRPKLHWAVQDVLRQMFYIADL